MDKERLFRNLERKYSSKCELAVNLPLGVDSDAIWEEVMESRRSRGIQLPLHNVNGEAYWYILTNKMISASEVIVEEFAEHDVGQQPHLNSVATIEEIYFTGFMEGAQISVQDAMHFLQSGEEPENVEELILLNNRQAAGFAAENMYHAIDENYLHNLAYFLTEGLDNGSGDFRNTDNIEIPSMQGESVKLPAASSITELVNQFAAFLADTKTHPLIKAAAAHAWVLAVRPFPEGNERLARLLSNVILIRAGYSFFGEVSISSVIARTSYDYFRAIANIMRTENGADMTYFLEYYMIVLSETVGELKLRRERQVHEMIEEEQQLARMPLSPAPVSAAVQENSDEIINVNSDAVSSKSSTVRQGSETFLKNMAKESRGLKQKAVARRLLKYLSDGRNEFSSLELAEEIGISRKSANNYLRKLEINKVIELIRSDHAGKHFAFSEYAVEDIQERKVCGPAVDALYDLAEKNNSVKSIFARIFLRYLEQGKINFTTAELCDETGFSNKELHNTLRYFRDKGMIINTKHNSNSFTVYQINVESVEIYSDNILRIISSLESSTSSIKDRRIGTILHQCLGKGFVSQKDYEAENALSKWNADMRFAAQLGLVEKNGDEYKILTELRSSYETLNDSQKKTLSALYDFFGEDMFSAEMVVAKLDYSSSHISGILHQFTWLRLLDCTANEDHSHIYQLNVNPTDHPECFGSVA